MKGLACLFILLGHFTGIYRYAENASQIDSWFVRILAEGPVSIFTAESFWLYLFFVISGYLLIISTPPRKIRDFLVKCAKRILRLAIPIWGTAIFIFVIQNTIGFYNHSVQAIVQNTWLTHLYGSRLTVLDILKEPFFVLILGTSKFNSPFWCLRDMLISSFLIYGVGWICKSKKTETMADYNNVSFKNNGRLKLLIIVGTRPEIIRLAAVINKTRKYFDVILAHTGQNYDYNLNGVFFHDLQLADPEVYMNAVGADLGETMGNIISESYKLMVAAQPDAVLVLGDTNSCLSAISAKRLHIPLFHMEAGNRCKDECLPEETNRRIVDVISDVNMAYSEHARRYLADTGLPKERTYVTGSPMAEVLHQNLDKIEASDIHTRLGLEKGKYILLSAHREENIDTEKNFISLFTAINKMAEKYNMPILYSCHPRSRKRLEQSGFQLDNRVIQHEPLGFHDYNCLQMNAFCVVSDSGTLPEESSFFTSVGHPFPAVCIRTSTERPEALDKGDFILAGIDGDHLLQAVDVAVEMNKNSDLGIPVPDYVDENVSDKVVKIIQSYTGIVNKMVWRKY